MQFQIGFSLRGNGQVDIPADRMGPDPGNIAGDNDIAIDRLHRNIRAFGNEDLMNDITGATAGTVLVMRVAIAAAALPFFKLQLTLYMDLIVRLVKAHRVIVIILIVIDIDRAFYVHLVLIP